MMAAVDNVADDCWLIVTIEKYRRLLHTDYYVQSDLRIDLIM